MVYGRRQICAQIETSDPAERVARIQRSGTKRHDRRGKRSTQRPARQTTRMGLHPHSRRQDHRARITRSSIYLPVHLQSYSDMTTVQNNNQRKTGQSNELPQYPSQYTSSTSVRWPVSISFQTSQRRKTSP